MLSKLIANVIGGSNLFLNPVLHRACSNSISIQPLSENPVSNVAGVQSCFKSGSASWQAIHENPNGIGRLSVLEATKLFSAACVLPAERLPFLVDLRDVQSLSSSKTKLQSYPSLFAFGEKIYNHYRNHEPDGSLSEREYFEKCISGGLREGKNRFVIRHWAPSLQWLNDGGSHRFATAYFMAQRDKLAYPIQGELIQYLLNREWLTSLAEAYDGYLFYIAQSDCHSLYTILDIHNSGHVFVDLSESGSPFDQPGVRLILLLIHKEEKLTWLARKWLKENIYSSATPFDAYLDKLCAIEEQSVQRINDMLSTAGI